jgi:hypothetical protein
MNLHPSSDSYAVVFLDNRQESRRVKELLSVLKADITKISVSTHEDDIPRLVTEERTFSGYKQIEQYCKAWLKMPPLSPR